MNDEYVSQIREWFKSSFRMFYVVWMQISLENGGCCVLLLVVIYMLRGVGLSCLSLFFIK